VFNPAIGAIDRCTTCHAGIADPRFADAPQPLRSHPDQALVHHDAGAIGCTVCHAGNGQGTTVEGGHGLSDYWERPLRAGVVTQASCGRCHAGEVPRAPVLDHGLTLVRRARCGACHDIGGRVPDSEEPDLDLAAIGDKTTPEWLVAWLSDPRRIQPRTLMPSFLLSPADARAIASYLSSLTREAFPHQVPEMSDDARWTLVDEGETVLGFARCVTCHPVRGRGGFDGTVGPDLGRVGNKVSARWLLNWLLDPHALQPDTRMPRYGLSEQQALAVALFVMSDYVGDDGDPGVVAPDPELREAVRDARLRDRGRQLVTDLSCLRCHRIGQERTEQPPGPELAHAGDLRLARLSLGDRAPEVRSLIDFFEIKLEAPRSFGPDLTMPEHRFDAAERQAIAVALLSFETSPVPELLRAPAPSSPTVPPPQGEVGALFSRYRCLTCHALAGRHGRISPDLAWEGSLARREWIEGFFANPVTIRPTLVERMPNLYASPDEAALLASFLSIAWNDDRVPADPLPPGPSPQELLSRGERLIAERRCQTCHIFDPSEPGGYFGPSLDRSGDRLRRGWIYGWLLDPQALYPSGEPRQDLSPEDARAMTAYLSSLIEAPPSATEAP
jgi:mono/diheme cytochrome c family protein